MRSRAVASRDDRLFFTFRHSDEVPGQNLGLIGERVLGLGWLTEDVSSQRSAYSAQWILSARSRADPSRDDGLFFLPVILTKFLVRISVLSMNWFLLLHGGRLFKAFSGS
ncbi:hypothetical protein Y696_11125 [Mesotoga sp. H07pep.5.4]|nr:hypothetical protein Y696_11125 [Mesotoga sp. H07pep.5.4]